MDTTLRHNTGEVCLACPTTEARRAFRSPAVVSVQATAGWADWRAVCLRPANLSKGRLRLGFRHAEDLSKVRLFAGRERRKCCDMANVLECENTLPDTISLSIRNYRI
jgi:hypothetical protein